ncbi:MAG TPA: PilZ domain-containing protein [Sandaracinaceae bacterium]
MSTAFRRRSQRVAVDLECQCVDAECVLIGDRIVNMSADGLLVRTAGTAKVGDHVIVSFRPPGSSVWIDAEARVTRLVTGTSPGAPGIALELVSTTPFERELLAATLERHRPRRHAPKRLPPLPPRARHGAVVTRSIVALSPPAPRD